MANNSFRDSVNSLGWSRRDPDLPVNTGTSSNIPFLSRLQSYNPFGEGGYVQLPTHNEGPGAPLPAATRREEEEGFFALSRWDRMLIFGACNLGAAICFMICFFLFPVLSLKPRKFAVLWSVGSVLFLLSWAVLMGPWTYAKHLVSGTRLPFTAAYFGAIALTLYFAIGVRKMDLFVFLCVSFLLSDFNLVCGLCASSHCTPTIPPLFMTLLSEIPWLSHTRSPSLYPRSYGRTARPGKGVSCSLQIHRAVQPETTACHACCWLQPI
ncbi:Golgi traffic protein SFT2, putative [Penicillium digitatum PHI26]|uniref:Protein transport protein SFT2 n=2 Tax=Penicillium digitatum TaxID=36651 RepID=K9G735_PEND2|nr:Golgi traffic protein SFT2, putative [Penicillium digitatum Pd1]EKV15413.1 Golgi traffic protein SFT2, putative [Penicillium digitatum Pd1]EKV17755.1 Golgi traffic protein SFT2, putative [Penicillium digitatum PHI26]